MASRSLPRSIREASRFTPITPHAWSKTLATAILAATPKTAPPTTTVTAASPPRSPQTQAKPPRRGRDRVPGETPEARVQRLRKARDAAILAQHSRVDRMILVGRRVADALHRFIVYTCIAFGIFSVFFTGWCVYDMSRFNRERMSEFKSTFGAIQSNKLDAARIAFINGSATEAQAELVEEANRRAEMEGGRLPPLLSKPRRPREKMASAVDPAIDPASDAIAAATAAATAEELLPVTEAVTADPALGEPSSRPWWRRWS